MGQQDILDFLKKEPKRWFERNKIAKNTGANIQSTDKSLRILRHHKEILYKPTSKRTMQPKFKYKYKNGL